MNMKLLKITRTDTEVRFVHEVKTETGFEERDHTAHEAPLKKFDDALKALGPVAAKVLELPATYADGITVQTLTLSYTKNGTRSAQIFFTKALDATSTQHPMKTPTFQVDDGGKDEDTRRQCTPSHAKAVQEMIDRAEDYANGKRQQMLLTFKEEAAKGKGKLEMLPGLQTAPAATDAGEEGG